MFKLKCWLALLAIGVIGGVGLMNGGSAKAETYDGTVSDFKITYLSRDYDNTDNLKEFRGQFTTLMRYKLHYAFKMNADLIKPGNKIKLCSVKLTTNSQPYTQASIDWQLGCSLQGFMANDTITDKSGKTIGTVCRSHDKDGDGIQEYYIKITDYPSVSNSIGVQYFEVNNNSIRGINYSTPPKAFGKVNTLTGTIDIRGADDKSVRSVGLYLTRPPIRNWNLRYGGGQPEFVKQGLNAFTGNGYVNITDALFRVTRNVKGETTDKFNANVNKQNNFQICQDMTVTTIHREDMNSILKFDGLENVGDKAKMNYRIRIPIVSLDNHFIDDGVDLNFFRHPDSEKLPITRVADKTSESAMKAMLDKEPNTAQAFLSKQDNHNYKVVMNITQKWVQDKVSDIFDKHLNDYLDSSFYLCSLSESDQKKVVQKTRDFLNKKLNGYMRLDMWGAGIFYEYPYLVKHIRESDYTLNVTNPIFKMEKGKYVEEGNAPASYNLSNGQSGIAIHCIDAETMQPVGDVDAFVGNTNGTKAINPKNYLPQDYKIVYAKSVDENHKNKYSITVNRNQQVSFPESGNWRECYIYCTKRKDPAKTASVDKVNFNGKPFTYDVKQQKHLIDTYLWYDNAPKFSLSFNKKIHIKTLSKGHFDLGINKIKNHFTFPV